MTIRIFYHIILDSTNGFYLFLRVCLFHTMSYYKFLPDK